MNIHTTDGDMFFVYMHTNTITGKKYIGMTYNPFMRFSGTGSAYKCNKRFYADIVKYGWENFEHRILCGGLTKLEAEYMESYYIEKFNTLFYRNGYNKVQSVREENYKPSEDKLKKAMAITYDEMVTIVNKNTKVPIIICPG